MNIIESLKVELAYYDFAVQHISHYAIEIPSRGGYDAKLYLMKLQFWRSGQCGVFLYYYYSQIHFDLEW